MNWADRKKQIEADIQDYIRIGIKPDEILMQDERLSIARYFSTYADGMFGWYPFNSDSKVLQIGSWYGAFSEMLAKTVSKICIYEDDLERRSLTKERLKEESNIVFFEGESIEDIEGHFDYIIWAVDEFHDQLHDQNSYLDILESAGRLLAQDGHILVALPNRFGMRYFCGVPDLSSGILFDGITENSGLYRLSKAELVKMLAELNYTNVKWYYPASELAFTQLVYTDSYMPKSEIKERLFTCHPIKDAEIISQENLLEQVIDNGLFFTLCNDFIIELTNSEPANVACAFLSAERDRDASFATVITTDNRVIKQPLYPDGGIGIKRLIDNHNKLNERGILTSNVVYKGSYGEMEYNTAPTLSAHIKAMISQGNKGYEEIIEELWKLILSSSDKVDASANRMANEVKNADWGPILKTAFIEMIPVNCFYVDGRFEFFDQEYTMDCIPAKYVLYRALRDIYHFSPEAENIIPLSALQKKYGLIDLWEYFVLFEERFQDKLRRRAVNTGYWYWKKGFDSYRNHEDRRIIVFGAGKYAERYLNENIDVKPVFAVDNNSSRWGEKFRDMEIKDPHSLIRLMPGTYRVIIAVKNYEPIQKQLDEMGIRNSDIAVYRPGKRYHIGYVAGAYDLFHIGHVNLFKRVKEYCDYLIVGVLDDDSIFSKKNKYPIIPCEQRVQMLKACKYVDQVEVLPAYDTSIHKAWELYHFDCMFTGDDHKDNPLWIKERDFLREKGSDLVFLPYTTETSSTHIREQINTQ